MKLIRDSLGKDFILLYLENIQRQLFKKFHHFTSKMFHVFNTRTCGVPQVIANLPVSHSLGI